MHDFTNVESNGYRFADDYGLEIDPEREQIIFGETLDWGHPHETSLSDDAVGQLARFTASYPESGEGSPISVDDAERLIFRDYLSPEQRFNDAPAVQQLIDSAKAVNEVAPEDGECRLIGYVVTPKRTDSRVTIEGAVYQGPVEEGDDVHVTFMRQFGTGYEYSESFGDDGLLRRWHD